MKKFIIGLTMACLVLLFGIAALAANTNETRTSSPPNISLGDRCLEPQIERVYLVSPAAHLAATSRLSAERPSAFPVFPMATSVPAIYFAEKALTQSMNFSSTFVGHQLDKVPIEAHFAKAKMQTHALPRATNRRPSNSMLAWPRGRSEMKSHRMWLISLWPRYFFIQKSHLDTYPANYYNK